MPTSPLATGPEAKACHSGQSIAAVLAILSILGLLSYPAPTAWLGLAVMLVLAAARFRTLGRPFPASPFTLPIGLYLGGALIGLYISLDRPWAEIRFFGLLGATAVFFLVLELGRSPASTLQIVKFWILAAFILTPLLCLFAASQIPVERLPRVLANVATAVEAASGPLRQTVGDDLDLGQRYRFRSSGLGALAGYALALVLGPLLVASHWRTRLLSALAAAYFAFFLLLAGNRVAILTSLLIVVLFSAHQYRRLRIVTLLGAVLVGGASLFAFGLGAGGAAPRLFSLPIALADPGPYFVRLGFWDNSLFLLGDFPFTGVGLGLPSVQVVYEAYFLPIDTRYRHAHNIFLQSYLEQGLLGLVGIIALTTLALILGWRTLARCQDPALRATSISATGAALLLVLTGLMEVVALTTLGMVQLFGALGLLAAASRLTDGRAVGQSPPPTWSTGAFAVVLSVLLALLGVVTLIFPRGGSSPVEVASIGRVLSTPASALFLNLGSLELARAELDEDTSRSEREKHLSTARQLLLAGLAIDPQHASLRRNLAWTATLESERNDSLQLLAQAESAADPDDSRFFFQIARIYQQEGEMTHALAAWARVAPSYGAWTCSGADVQLILSGAQMVRRGEWQNAIAVNRAAIEAAPTQREPYAALATALVQTDGRNAALAQMRDLALLRPNVPWPYREAEKLAATVDGATMLAMRERATASEASPEWKLQKAAAARKPPCDNLLARRLSRFNLSN